MQASNAIGTLAALSLDPAVADLILGGLALLFAKAAFDKFVDLGRFRDVLDAYDLLPSPLVAPGAFLMPAVEMLIGVALLVGCVDADARTMGSLGAALLLGAYGGAIGINLLRGRAALDCGCTPAGERRRIGPWMVARNALLASAALLFTLPAGTRDLDLVDAPLIVGGVLACAALYSSLDLLFGKVAPVTAALRASR